MNGFMYILECANGKYYVGSTNDLKKRIAEHQRGEGANFTLKHLPVKLVYFEEFEHVEEAFLREKQVQSWSRAKKEALIYGWKTILPALAECQNITHSKYRHLRESKVESKPIVERSRDDDKEQQK